MTSACMTPAETWCWQAHSSQRSWREHSYRYTLLWSATAFFMCDQLTCHSTLCKVTPMPFFQSRSPRSACVPESEDVQTYRVILTYYAFECRSKRSPVSWRRVWRCWIMRWRRRMTFCTGWSPNQWPKGCAKESQLSTLARSEWEAMQHKIFFVMAYYQVDSPKKQNKKTTDVTDSVCEN